MRPLTFNKLRTINVKRSEEVFHPLNDWSPTDWGCAMAGEVGEACNFIKKLRRLDDPPKDHGTARARNKLRFAIADELADIIIYADLVAARLHLSLEEAVVTKFNTVSRKRKSKHFL